MHSREWSSTLPNAAAVRVTLMSPETHLNSGTIFCRACRPHHAPAIRQCRPRARASDVSMELPSPYWCNVAECDLCRRPACGPVEHERSTHREGRSLNRFIARARSSFTWVFTSGTHSLGRAGRSISRECSSSHTFSIITLILVERQKDC